MNTHAKFQSLKPSVAMCFFLQRDFRFPVARGPEPRIVNILEKRFFDKTR